MAQMTLSAGLSPAPRRAARRCRNPGRPRRPVGRRCHRRCRPTPPCRPLEEHRRVAPVGDGEGDVVALGQQPGVGGGWVQGQHDGAGPEPAERGLTHAEAGSTVNRTLPGRCLTVIVVESAGPSPGRVGSVPPTKAQDRLVPGGMVQAQGTCLEPRPGSHRGLHRPAPSQQLMDAGAAVDLWLDTDTAIRLHNAADRTEHTLVGNAPGRRGLGSGRAR